MINIFDPDVIVLGGGLSKLAHLYEVLPDLAAPHVFAEPAHVVVKPPAVGRCRRRARRRVAVGIA